MEKKTKQLIGAIIVGIYLTATLGFCTEVWLDDWRWWVIVAPVHSYLGWAAGKK